MGKSTAAKAFRRARIPVFDADAAVHRLQAPGGAALPAIAAAFPGTVVDGVLDRGRLRAAVVGDEAAIKRLEHIMHPRVRHLERAFLARARRSRAPAAVLDIPLLLETGGDARVDLVVVVSAPRAVQLARAASAERHDGRTDLGHHRPPDAGCAKAPPRRSGGADRPLAQYGVAAVAKADPGATPG